LPPLHRRCVTTPGATGGVAVDSFQNTSTDTMTDVDTP